MSQRYGYRGEWIERTDPRTGKVYYYNPKSAVTSWTLPKEVTLRSPAEATELLNEIERGEESPTPRLVFSQPDEAFELNIFRSELNEFTIKLRSTRSLKYLSIGDMEVGPELGEALVSSPVDDIRFDTDESHDDERLSLRRHDLLGYLAKKQNLRCLKIIGETVDEPASYALLSSSVLMNSLTILNSWIWLRSKTHFSAPFYRTKLVRLNVAIAPKQQGLRPQMFLKAVSGCERLQKLTINEISSNTLFKAFPKWRGELENLFPITNCLKVECNNLSTNGDMLMRGVAPCLKFSNHQYCSEFDLTGLLASLERKPTPTKIIKHSEALNPDVCKLIVFVANLRPTDGTQKSWLNIRGLRNRQTIDI